MVIVAVACRYDVRNTGSFQGQNVNVTRACDSLATVRLRFLHRYNIMTFYATKRARKAIVQRSRRNAQRVRGIERDLTLAYVLIHGVKLESNIIKQTKYITKTAIELTANNTTHIKN